MINIKESIFNINNVNTCDKELLPEDESKTLETDTSKNHP